MKSTVESAPQRPNTFQIGLMAARPKTLPAAAAPVIAGIGVAIHLGAFRAGPALAALLGALFLQIAANYANDVYDFQKGVDTHARLGPTRVTQAGLFTPRQTLMGMWIFFGLAGLCGIYLAAQAGWPVIVAGLLAILVAIAYTGGPFPLGYNGLGEIFVFIFFGLVAVCGTVFVQAGQIPALAVWASVPMGLLADGILSMNNLRDLETDRATGKRTLAARFGPGVARAVYVGELAIAFLTPVVMVVLRIATPWALLCWGAVALAIPLIKMTYTVSGRPLNKALAGTGQMELVFGVLFAVGMALGRG
ncbi:MAG TPA: 1,4-dihydroxy-2-naphthoate polyprenyltransferase [Anaerolineaceae bacterium]|jgi:1,4-dihydroxy-2-naphthoate octaprenyltransferase